MIQLHVRRTDVEKVVVIVFGSEGAARQGVRALYDLEDDARIVLYELAAIRRNGDGTMTRMREDNDFPAPSGTLAGAALGSLIGLLGGGIGFAAGAGIGALIGLVRDVHTASVDAEFLAEVSSVLTPGKFAVAADILEEQVTPLDRRMEALGGGVFRAPKIADDERRVREAGSRRAELKELEEEHAGAEEDRKPGLLRRIEELRAKLDRRLEGDRLQRERIIEEMRAKARAPHTAALEAGAEAAGAPLSGQGKLGPALRTGGDRHGCNRSRE